MTETFYHFHDNNLMTYRGQVAWYSARPYHVYGVVLDSHDSGRDPT